MLLNIMLNILENVYVYHTSLIRLGYVYAYT